MEDPFLVTGFHICFWKIGIGWSFDSSESVGLKSFGTILFYRGLRFVSYIMVLWCTLFLVSMFCTQEDSSRINAEVERDYGP